MPPTDLAVIARFPTVDLDIRGPAPYFMTNRVLWEGQATGSAGVTLK